MVFVFSLVIVCFIKSLEDILAILYILYIYTKIQGEISLYVCMYQFKKNVLVPGTLSKTISLQADVKKLRFSCDRRQNKLVSKCVQAV